MGDEQVVLTRRSDGARFTIHMQARSPNGPCELRAVTPPHEMVRMTNDRLDIYFADPRKSAPQSAAFSLDVSGIPSAEDYERREGRALRERARSDAERILAAVKQHLDGARKHPFDPVGRGGNLSDGGVAMANKALAPLGWRVTFPMTNEGPLDSTRRWCLERVS